MHKFYLENFKAFILSLLLVGAFATNLQAQQTNFDQSDLDLNGQGTIGAVTSIMYGPDDRLYVAEYTGEIKVLTVQRNSSTSYIVTSMETLDGIQTMADHNDDGTAHTSVARQVTGLTVAGTAANPIIYVTSSDIRIGAGNVANNNSNGDVDLDTNSGVITRFTWTGATWAVVDLVRGLPRSEENHATNGLELTSINSKPYLLVASGGFTNGGSPSANFVYTCEYALSGAILSVDLDAINALPTLTDSGRSYIYDLPTLDDPTRANANGIDDPDNANYTGEDVNDPFGGNDGLNQAVVVPNGPVQIFSPGYRNSYDLVVTESGALYATDNGANGGWGGFPVGEGGGSATNAYDPAEPGSQAPSGGEQIDNVDHLELITQNLQTYTPGSFYAGHPNPTRANPTGAGLYTAPAANGTVGAVFRTQTYDPDGSTPGSTTDPNLALPANWPPVATANTVEGDWRGPTEPNPDGPTDNPISTWGTNTNGIDEYTASDFGGVLQGNLLAGHNGGNIRRVELDGSGQEAALDQTFLSGIGGNALAISCNSDVEIFPGTIWAGSFSLNTTTGVSSGKIVVFEPAPLVNCIDPSDPAYDANADYDSDGYTNQDEEDNFTDPCNGGSQPDDFDKVAGAPFVSDLNDTDDDADGVLDSADPFQLGEPSAGGSDAFMIPISNGLFNDQQGLGGYLGLGMTGLMNNGDTGANWLDWIDRKDDTNDPNPNDVLGGATGLMTSHMTSGTALGTTNTQEKGYQYGIQTSSATGTFTVLGNLINLDGPLRIYGNNAAVGGELGHFIGDGTQSDYIKIVLTANGITALQEINDIPQTPLTVNIPTGNRPTSSIVFYFVVNAANGQVDLEYVIDGGARASIGTVTAQGGILSAIQQANQDLAVGFIGTSGTTGVELEGTWDFLNVIGQDPIVTQELPNLIKAINSPNETIDLNNYFFDDEGLANLTYTVQGNSNNAVGATISGNILTLSYPATPAVSDITIRATDSDTFFVDDTFTVTVTDGPIVLYRVNSGGPQIPAIDGGFAWEGDTPPGNGSQYLSVTGSNQAYNSTNIPVDGSVDQGTTPMDIYATERYDSASGAPNLTYSFPVSQSGNYEVRLYMANSFPGTSDPGERVFDVQIEGFILPLLDNVDLSDTYGHLTGTVVSHTLKVTDGAVDINFLHVGPENPLINAIEILDASEDDTPIYVYDLANQFNNPGQALDGSLGVNAVGGDGNLTYAASGLPTGVFIEPTNGQIGGTIDAAAEAGSPYTVTITVNDSDGSNTDTATMSFIWTIGSSTWVLKNENQNYTARHENSFVQAGNKFYLMGGRENAQTVDVYDYTSDSWVNLTASAPSELNHFQATEYQGLIWVIGAFADNGFPNEVPEEFIWAFDPATNDWIQGPQIPATRRRGSTGLVVQNNKFYIIGGNTIGHSGGYVPWFDEYDPATGVWTPLADAPRPRDHFNAAVIGNELYVAGGRLSGGAGGTFAPTISEVDVYNFGSNSWSTLPSGQNIPTPRGGAAVVTFDDKLVVIGGEVQNQLVYGVNTTDALPITEEYNPATQTWTRLDDLNNERHGTQAISSGLGIFILGGSPNLGGGSQKIMEYLGSDNPIGVASASSTFSAPANVTISDGTSEDIVLNVGNGNVGVIVTSMVISGPDAADFTITSGELTNQLLSINSNHTTTVNLAGTGANRSAILTINYSDGEAITVNLANFDSNLNVGNPGTQNNNEGDVVSLQIQANGASNYTATGLPPTLTINPTTGLISGTVSSGGGNTGPFEEQNGLVVVEAESGNIVNNWTQTTTGGATGIIAGADHLSNQNGGTIPYQVTVTTPGVYRFNWRSFYSGGSATDENDNWLRFPNNNDVWFFGFKGTPANEASLIANVSSANPTNIVFPKGSSRITATTTPEGSGGNGYFKIYRAGGASEVYDWQAKTSDNDSHDIYVWFANPGTFTMEISERSAGHAIDKVALYKLDGTNYSDTQLTNAPESQQSGGIGAADNSPYTVTVSVEDNGNPPSTANTQFTWYIGQTGDPIANAEANPINGLIPLDVNFTGSNSTDDVAVTSYLWDFKDGSATVTDPNPMHTFTVAGTYEVELTVEDGDGNQSTTTVTITASNPSAADDILINSGGPALTFDGDNWSADTNFIGGDIFEKIIPIENTLNDELYQTERYGPSGATVVYQIPVGVNGDYNVDLHFAELFFGLPGNGSAGGVGSRIFNVDIENGQEQLTNYDIFEVAGQGAYAIVESFKTVTVNDGNLTITLTAVVENPKISGIGVFKTTAPEVNAGIDQTITLPTNNVVLNGTATDADGGAIGAYLWTQESGPSIATLVGANTADLTASDLVEGTYVFRLTATDDENAIGFDDVSVIVQPEGANMAPTAVVSATPLTGDSPLEVTFTGSNSTDDVAVVSYAWDFMDGNTSIDADPIHTFTADGSYAVELTVTDAEGLTDTAIVTITVGAASNMAPTAIATATPLTGDVPLEVTFTGSNSTDDVAVVTYAWDFQDGNTSSDADPVYTFTSVGTYEVELTVTDAEGLTDIATVTIIVGTTGNQAPVAIAEATPTAGDPPLEVSFTGSNSTDDVAVVTYAWDFMDGTTSSEADPVHTFTADGLYNVQLTVTDAEGLTDTAIVSIAVGDVSNLPPVAVIEAEPFGAGAPLIVQFTGSNSTDDFSIESYEWDFGDATAGSTEVNPEHIYTLPGMYTVSLTVTDAEGLTNTATFDIVVLEGTKLDILLEANPPNPNDGGIVRVIVVNQPENVEVINITVHDIGGRYVAGHRASDIRVNNMYEVPVSTYRNGVYLVRVVMSDGESTLLKLFVAN